MADLLSPLHQIPIKERLSVLYIERGQLDVLDGAVMVVDVTGVRTHIPVGGVAVASYCQIWCSGPESSGGLV